MSHPIPGKYHQKCWNCLCLSDTFPNKFSVVSKSRGQQTNLPKRFQISKPPNLSSCHWTWATRAFCTIWITCRKVPRRVDGPNGMAANPAIILEEIFIQIHPNFGARSPTHPPTRDPFPWKKKLGYNLVPIRWGPRTKYQPKIVRSLAATESWACCVRFCKPKSTLLPKKCSNP